MELGKIKSHVPLFGWQITGHPIEPRTHSPGVKLLRIFFRFYPENWFRPTLRCTLSPSRIHPRKSRLNYRERKGGITQQRRISTRDTLMDNHEIRASAYVHYAKPRENEL